MSVVWGSIFVSLRIIVDTFCEDVQYEYVQEKVPVSIIFF